MLKFGPHQSTLNPLTTMKFSTSTFALCTLLFATSVHGLAKNPCKFSSTVSSAAESHVCPSQMMLATAETTTIPTTVALSETGTELSLLDVSTSLSLSYLELLTPLLRRMYARQWCSSLRSLPVPRELRLPSFVNYSGHHDDFILPSSTINNVIIVILIESIQNSVTFRPRWRH